jgi:hypothetical protein
MRKLPPTICSLALLVTAVLALSSLAQAQTTTGVSVARGAHPSWEGRAAGDVQPFARTGEDLKSALLSHPAPEIWLEFKEGDKEEAQERAQEATQEGEQEGQPASQTTETEESAIKVILPPEAEAVLKSFWEEALKFDYNEAFVKPRSAQEVYDRDMAWSEYFSVSVGKLRKIEIAAPDANRAISDREATALIYFVRKASSELVKSAKEQ